MRDARFVAGRPSYPWGDDPPPAPADVTDAERRRVRRAWRSWRPRRPHYRLDGEVVEAEIDLHDRVWSGRAGGRTVDEAAWAALQACILRWEADVPAIEPAAWLARRFARRRAR